MNKHYVFRHQSCAEGRVMRERIPILSPNFNCSLIIRASIHLVWWFTYDSLLYSFLPLHLILFYCILLLPFIFQFRRRYFMFIFRWMLLCIPIYPNCWRRLALLFHLFVFIITQRFFSFQLFFRLLSLMFLRQLQYFLLTLLSVNATHFLNFCLCSFIEISQTQTNFLTFLLGFLRLFVLFLKVLWVNLTINERDLIEDAIKEVECRICDAISFFHHFRINYFLFYFV